MSDTIAAAGTLDPPAVAPPPRRRGSGFARYLAGKAAAACVSLLVTLVIGFVLFSLMPADPVQSLTRGRPTSDAQMAELRRQLGLDQSVPERFLSFVGDVLTGNLGTSWEFQQPVSELIGERLWPTLLLTGTATAISVLLGLWLGVRAGWRQGGKLDRIASATSLTLWSVPTFWLGIILLITFSVGVGPLPGFLPAGGMSDPAVTGGLDQVLDVAWHLVLPCLTMVLVVFAQYVTVMRSSVIDELGSPYLLTARAKGLRDEQVRRRHAVPNALLPSVTMIFMQLGTVVGGAITVETVYSWPGLGLLSYQALKVPDLPLLQGTYIVFSASVILMNLLADVVYRFLDPRVRAQ
ncbi:ABC transporter permease [Streptomyces sp. NPDC060194]|uniref:ABC transporter permease n=1 Tax=Streptomyces sp. NPDC060194 TaxID=3347069 RepID=UPI0036613376